MLSSVLDIFRMRQYFDVVVRARQWAAGVRDDLGLLADVRRGLLPLPLDRPASTGGPPFPPAEPLELGSLDGLRVAVVATGGSGALASVVGVARALEEAGVRPAAYSLCSGSALFGFPLAAGVPAEEVADFVLGLRPGDYVDVDWPAVARLVPTAARGFAGLMRGDHLEDSYRRLLGDMTLGDLETPAYAPVWNVEENRTEYIGPRTHPELPVARAVHMAVALPLFVEPVALDGHAWCDGGIVDIFPVRPVLDIETPPDLVLAVTGFYPPGFAGEDANGWRERRASILVVAGQVRTCQQAELARVNLARLRAACEVVMVEPVPYEVVAGVGFYRQFLSTRDWAGFMQAGRLSARRALAARDRAATGRKAPAGAGGAATRSR